MLESREKEYNDPRQREHHRHAAMIQRPQDQDANDDSTKENEMEQYAYDDNRDMHNEDMDHEQEGEQQLDDQTQDRQIGKLMDSIFSNFSF